MEIYIQNLKGENSWLETTLMIMTWMTRGPSEAYFKVLSKKLSGLRIVTKSIRTSLKLVVFRN